MLHVCVNLVTGYPAWGKPIGTFVVLGFSVVVCVCLVLNSDMELQWMLGGGWARRGKEIYLLNAVILCNSGSHLQNWILINTSFIVCFSCFCQYRGGDYGTFIHLWPVSDCLLQKQNMLLKVFFHFALYNACDCCWVKPEVLSPDKVYLLVFLSLPSKMSSENNRFSGNALRSDEFTEKKSPKEGTITQKPLICEDILQDIWY